MSKTSVPIGQIWAPRFAGTGEGDRLEVELSKRSKRTAPPDLLARFCAISEAPNTQAAVISFAKKWGMLGLCRHGRPLGHTRSRCQARAFETAEAWKEMALCLDSMRRIGQALNRGETGDDLDWQLADGWLSGSKFTPWDELYREATRGSVDSARTGFMTLARKLIQICSVQPRFHWSRGVWNLDMDSEGLSNLPAILTTQLMLEVAGANNSLKCSNCPRWFIPSRNQRKYCSHCGIRAAWRNASKRAAAKKKKRKA